MLPVFKTKVPAAIHSPYILVVCTWPSAKAEAMDSSSTSATPFQLDQSGVDFQARTDTMESRARSLCSCVNIECARRGT